MEGSQIEDNMYIPCTPDGSDVEEQEPSGEDLELECDEALSFGHGRDDDVDDDNDVEVDDGWPANHQYHVTPAQRAERKAEWETLPAPWRHQPHLRDLRRANATVGMKEPRKTRKRDVEEAEEPDLGAFFALFENFSELDQVKYCRAYANMLSAKTPANRLRYSTKGASTWNKKKN